MNRFQENFGYLREVLQRHPCDNTSTSGRGRGRGRGKGKAKGRGHLVGGGELESTLDVLPTTTATRVVTRTVGQTVAPRVRDVQHQTISCNLCGGLGHVAMLCEQEFTRVPPSLNCRQCTHTYTRGDQKMTTVTVYCSAHRTPETETEPEPPACTPAQRKKAIVYIANVTSLLGQGKTLTVALKYVGISLERYNKYRERAA